MLAAPPPTAAPISAPLVPPIAPPTPAPAAADPPIIRAVFVFERSGSRSYSALVRRATWRDVRYAAGRAWLRPSTHSVTYLPLLCATAAPGTPNVPAAPRVTIIKTCAVLRNMAPLPRDGLSRSARRGICDEVGQGRCQPCLGQSRQNSADSSFVCYPRPAEWNKAEPPERRSQWIQF